MIGIYCLYMYQKKKPTDYKIVFMNINMFFNLLFNSKTD